MHTCVYVHVCVCVCMHTCVCVHVCVSVHACVWCGCMCMCLHEIVNECGSMISAIDLYRLSLHCRIDLHLKNHLQVSPQGSCIQSHIRKYRFSRVGCTAVFVHLQRLFLIVPLTPSHLHRMAPLWVNRGTMETLTGRDQKRNLENTLRYVGYWHLLYCKPA